MNTIESPDAWEEASRALADLEQASPLIQPEAEEKLINATIAPESASPEVLEDLKRAGAYVNCGLISEAAEVYASILDSHTDPRALLGIARCTYELRRLHEALGYLQILSSIDPDYPDLANDMGVILFEMGCKAQASEQFVRAAAQNPDDIKVWLNVMDLTYDIGDYRQSITACRRILELDPNNADALAVLARITNPGN